MALTQINVGTVPDDGTGDTLRSAMLKINNAFTQIDTNTDDIAALSSVENEVLRVAWKPPGTVTLSPTAVGTGEPLPYTHTTQASTHVSANIVSGEFTFQEDISASIWQINVQAAKTSGGFGLDIWGVYFQTFNGSSWVDVPDTLRIASVGLFNGSVASISYSVSTGAIPAGAQYRLMHIKDTPNTMGPYSTTPWSSAPSSPGVVVSIDTIKIL